MKFAESMGVVFDKLQNFLRTETIIGEPITVGNVTIIPVINVSFGAGSGTGGGTDEKGNNGEGGGGGGGGKVSPSAIIIIKNDDVSVVPIHGKGSLEKIVEMVPEIVTKLNPKQTQNNNG